MKLFLNCARQTRPQPQVETEPPRYRRAAPPLFALTWSTLPGRREREMFFSIRFQIVRFRTSRTGSACGSTRTIQSVIAPPPVVAAKRCDLHRLCGTDYLREEDAGSVKGSRNEFRDTDSGRTPLQVGRVVALPFSKFTPVSRLFSSGSMKPREGVWPSFFSMARPSKVTVCGDQWRHPRVTIAGQYRPFDQIETRRVRVGARWRTPIGENLTYP